MNNTNIIENTLNESFELIEDIVELLETEIYFIGLGNSKNEREAKEILDEAMFLIDKAKEILIKKA